MKKTLLTFVAFFAMMSMALAQKFTWTSADWAGVADNAQTISMKAGEFTFTADKAAGKTNPTIASANDLRVYALGTLNIASAKNFKKVVFNLSNKRRLAEIAVDNGQVVVDKDAWTLTWTGDAKNVTFTVGEKNVYGSDPTTKAGQFCIGSIVVGEGGGEVKPDPTPDPQPQPQPQPEGDAAFSADFANDLCGFTIENKNLSEGLTEVWTYEGKFHSMKATASVKNAAGEHIPHVSEAWAVSPVIDLANVKGSTLTFVNKANFFGDLAGFQAACSVKVKAEGADWTNVTVENPASGAAWDKVTSTADLKAFDGKKIQIAFVYTSTATVAGTWEFVSVKVAAKGGEVKPEPQPEPQPEEGNVIFSETFANETTSFTIEDITLPEGSTYVWKLKERDGVKYMQGSAFVGGAKAAASNLVSPVIDLTNAKSPVLSFDNLTNYFKGTFAEACQINIKVEGSEWAALAVDNLPSTDSWDFVKSTADLKAFAGKKIQIRFVYTSDTTIAGTWRIKDLKVTDASSTGIEGVEAENGAQVIYDLSGRRVAKAVKGLYIINGKKVYVK